MRSPITNRRARIAIERQDPILSIPAVAAVWVVRDLSAINGHSQCAVDVCNIIRSKVHGRTLAAVLVIILDVVDVTDLKETPIIGRTASLGKRPKSGAEFIFALSSS